jgi:hypothetical protein
LQERRITITGKVTLSLFFVVLPPFLDIQPGSIFGVWNTFAGGANTLATENPSGIGTYYTGQNPDNLIDSSLTSRYSSRGSSTGSDATAGLNTGFFASVPQCLPTLVGFRLINAYPNIERDPLTLTVEGTNCDIVIACTNWTLLYNGSSGLENMGNVLDYGEFQSIWNNVTYRSYRFLMTSKRNISSFVSYGGVQLFGYSNQNSTGQNRTSSKYVNLR